VPAAGSPRKQLGVPRSRPLFTKLNDVDPQARLAGVLGRIADHNIADLAALLSWSWSLAIPVEHAA
jgi:IS66 C-terminal element